MRSAVKPLKAEPVLQGTPLESVLRPEPSVLTSVQRFLQQKPLGAIGAVLIVVFILTALFAPWIAPYEYDKGSGGNRLQGPSSEHMLGTDNLGRDMFSRIVYGARISVAVGFGAVFVGTGIATVLGILSGYWGGRFDLILQRFIDVWISIPALILLITMVTVFTNRNTNSETSVVIVAVTLGVLVAAGSSRIVRSARFVIVIASCQSASDTVRSR